jgi:ribosome biogenesis GTPase A
MAKAKRQAAENLKLVDMVVELLDARIPKSSTNPDFQRMFHSKIRLVVFNKNDHADPAKLRHWTAHYTAQGVSVLPMNALNQQDIKRVRDTIFQIADQKRTEIYERKRIHKTIRAMVVGIPNVGKSTFINSLAGAGKAKTGDRPGVTKGPQMVRVTPYFELLDTPGLLWPNLEDEITGLHLAYTGAIREEILDLEEVANAFLEEMAALYPDLLQKRYSLETLPGTGPEITEAVAKSRGWLRSGGMIDTARAARQILDEYQAGLIGRTTLELPN